MISADSPRRTRHIRTDPGVFGPVTLTIALLGGCVGSVNPIPSGTGGNSSDGTGAGAGGMVAGSGGILGSGGGGSGLGGAGLTGSTGGTSGGAGGMPAGTGGRSGTGGSGTAGAAGSGGVSLCVPGRYAICEGFEAAAVGTNVAPAGWTRTGAVDIVADPANVYRGAHSLRINPALNGPRRINMTGAAVTGLTGNHWGRIFYKMQTPVPVSCDPCCGMVLHTTFVGLDGVGPTGGAGEYRMVDTVENIQGMHQFIYNIQYNSGPETGRGSAYNYKYDGNWHCAEWHVDNTTGTIQYFYDGAQVSLSGNASDFPPSFTALHVGLNNYQMACTPYMSGWIDEIALDRTRIGCGN